MEHDARKIRNQVIDETLRMSLVVGIATSLAAKLNTPGECQPGQLAPEDAVRLTYRMVDEIERAEEARQLRKDEDLVEHTLRLVGEMRNQPREFHNIPTVIAKASAGIVNSKNPDVLQLGSEVAKALTSPSGKARGQADVTEEVVDQVVEALQRCLERMRAH